MKIILVITAHPDDEIIGCGGSMAKFVKNKDKVYVLILGHGIDSRQNKNADKQMQKLREACLKANKIMGVEEVFIHDFPDQRFDTVPILDIIKKIEEIKSKVNPEIVFTHSRHDLNKDHRTTYEAVITAFRPLSGESCKEIYSFEVLSSTEWNCPIGFSPNVFVDISKTIHLKNTALECYSSEMRDRDHPRNISNLVYNCKLWGVKNGLGFAEAFECVRILK